MEKILIGFQIGLLIALIAFIISAITGKKHAAIKPNLLIVAALIVIIYQMPFTIYHADAEGTTSISLIALIKLIAASIVLAVLVSYIVGTIAEIYNASSPVALSNRSIEIAKQLLYGIALFGPVILVLLAPFQAIIGIYDILKSSILVTLGLWGALKLFWSSQTTKQ